MVLPMVLPLLLLVLPVPSLAGSDSSPLWYTHQYENNFMESMLVLVFVSLALGFELAWHHIRHIAEHSYAYGKYHDQVIDDGPKECQVNHPQLYKELTNRMGGEFMTLGFLAFAIFLFNQLGGFKVLAENFPPCDGDCFHIPATDSDWLHLAELVHVKLFSGMLLYYVLILFLVRGSVRQIQQWEKLRLRVVKAGIGSLHDGAAIRRLDMLDLDLEKHMLWRDYFITKVLRWRIHRPALWKTVMEKLSLDPEAEDGEMRLRHSFDERFSLSAYLSLNLESGVCDSIQVHLPTWAVVICFFGVFALLHHEAHLELTTLVPMFIVVNFITFLLMWYLSKERQTKIQRYIQRCQSDPYHHHHPDKFDSEKPDGSTTAERANIHERFNTETILLRALQVFMFMISYIFAQTLVDVHEWKVNTERTLLNSLAFTVLFFVLAKFLPHMVPIFLVVMSFPPYVDEANLAAFFNAFLDDYAKEHKADQGYLEQVPPSGGAIGHATTASEGGGGGASATVSLAEVRELADILGVGRELEQRLRSRGVALATSRGEDSAPGAYV